MAGFESLVVWREASELAANTIAAVRGMRGIGAWSAARQLVRSTESVAHNIAEGHGRGVSRDGLRFLRTARSSCSEAQSQLRLARRVGRLPGPVVDTLLDQAIRVGYLLDRYIRSVESRLQSL